VEQLSSPATVIALSSDGRLLKGPQLRIIASKVDQKRERESITFTGR